MATITAAAAGGAWQTNATWVGGVRPTAADDVLLTATSGNVTIDSGAVCRSLTCTGYTGTLTHTAAVTLTIGDGTAGLSNVALLLVAGMTYTLGNAATSAISFVSTSATQQTVTTGGKVLGNLTFSGAGGSWQHADACAATGATISHLAGTLNTNSQSISCVNFLSGGATTRTLTLGSSAITCSGTSGFQARFSSLTITANTAVVTLTVATSPLFGAASSTAGNFNGLSVVFAGVSANAQMVTNGTSTIANLTVTGNALKTAFMTISPSWVVTGTLTLTGNSLTNRLLVQSLTLGTAASITAATVSLTNVDFMDVTGAGAASPFTGTSLGDCQGNSGITFTTPATQTWQGTASGSWSDVTKWTSRVPLPQDDVVIASAFVAGRTVTADMPRLGTSIDWTGTTGAPIFTISVTPASVFGSFTLAAGVGTMSSTSTITLRGRGSHTITSAGKDWVQIVLQLLTPTGTYTFTDAYTASNSDFIPQNGTLVDGGFSHTVRSFSNQNFASNIGTNVLTLTGTWTLNGNAAIATPWNVVAATTTVTASASTIILAGALSTTRTFAGGGKTYGTLTYTVAGSTGALVITGANTFGTINFSDVTNARTLTLPSSTTTTVTNFNVNGTAGKLMTVNSSTSGTAATLSKSSGYVQSDYLSVKDSTATGGATWYAGANSTNVSGNTGWIFTAPALTVTGTQATTTDLANAGTPAVAITGTQATTTSTANTGTIAVTWPGTQATSTATANGGSPDLAVTGIQAVTTATGNSGLAAVSFPGNQATETDTASTGTPVVVLPSVTVAGSQASTTDAASTGTVALTWTGSQATETDLASPGLVAITIVVLGTQASETSTANTGSPVIAWAGAQALTADIGTAGATSFGIDGSQAVETSTANTGSFSVRWDGSQANATDTAMAGTVLVDTFDLIPGSTTAAISTASTAATASVPLSTASAS